MTDSSEQQPFPSKGRLMGLDFGTKRIGIAVSDDEQKIASPLQNYTRGRADLDGQYLCHVAEDYQCAGAVVGLPVHMSGDEGEKAREARAFGTWVGEVTGLPVCYWDERFSTAVAEGHLMAADLSNKKRKARRDKLAAQIILQSFLDAEDRDRRPAAMRD